ncbi:Ig-like domain-containing protein, partial [Sulfitobacter sp.]|uniref:Ig-like domain-containing protein n=1 Tax=Sulfitobacter sp. TaxID=1903071 RepID=UPI003EF694C9
DDASVGTAPDASADLTLTVNDVNDAPVVSAPISVEVDEETASFTVNLLDNVTDEDAGDTLTVSGLQLVDVDADDAGVSVSEDGNSLTVDPSLYAGLNTGETLQLDYIYNVTDAGGETVAHSASIVINGLGVEAQAFDDNFTTDEATSIIGGDLFADNGNGTDADEDGDTFVVTAVDGQTAAVGSQIEIASGALLTVRADGTFDYDPNGVYSFLPSLTSGADFTADTDTFSYTLTDGSTATVTINVGGLDSDGDLLIGTENDDVLIGGIGGDFLLGSGGSDTASYVGSAGFVNVSLLSGYAGGGSGSHAIGDTFDSIENLTGSSFDDLLSGDTGANILNGADGNDMLRGRGGADALIGGAGLDTADYTGSGGFVNVSLGSGYAGGGTGSHAIGDTFDSIENLRGSSFGDRLNGNSGNNVLEGRGGADILNGYGGVDTATYALSGAAVTVSLATGLGSGGEAEGDVLTGIENLIGSAFDDTLTGDSGANTLTGGDGNDILAGGGGADALFGGVGVDRASYANSAGFVNVSLLSGYAGGGAGSTAIGDTFDSIEGLTGSIFNDRLNGDNNNNILDGGAGGDVMKGNGGLDVVDYSNSAGSVNVSLLTGFAGGGAGSYAFTGGGSAGPVVRDTFIGIEGFIGSNFADRLNGSNNADFLDGGAGDDIIRGNGGDDVMLGGAGTDQFIFGDGFGADTIMDFEDGIELLDFSAHSATSFADLTVSSVGVD